MSSMTEYFLAADLCYLLRETLKLKSLSSVDDYMAFFAN